MNAPRQPLCSPAGYEATRFNALRHGVLSRYTVLPWEDGAEYQALLEALVQEHGPQGPTEEHLVEELAGILWRKRRLRLAEGAAFRKGLKGTTDPFSTTAANALAHFEACKEEVAISEAIAASPTETKHELEELTSDERQTQKAIDILRSGKAKGAYGQALRALVLKSRQAWEEVFEYQDEEEDDPYTEDAKGLLRWLETDMARWMKERRIALDNRDIIRDQAFGEAFDPDDLGKIARYEVHLDRKLERTLAMLLRLKDLRRGADAG